MRKTFASLINPIEINSPKAQKIRDDHYICYQKNLEHRNKLLLKESRSAQQISSFLDNFYSGNLAAWWNINREMTLEPDSQYEGQICQELDLIKLPGWKTADAETKAKLIKAAEDFVLKWNPQAQELDLFVPEFSGYKALRLLLHENPSFVSSMPVDVWKKWAPTILITYSISSDTRYVEPHHKLMKMAYQYANTEIINRLMDIIDKENEKDGDINIIRAVRDCWDERLATTLLAKLKDKKLKPNSIGQLLENLLAHKVDEARVFAESLVVPLASCNQEERSKAVIAANKLIKHAKDAGWSVVWPAIQKDPEFGREVAEKVSYRRWHTRSLESRLREEQVADLYIWLTQQYPGIDKPKQQNNETDFSIENYKVTPTKSVAMWKNYILDHLKQRGAYKAIQRIIQEFPEMEDKVKWMFLEAKNIACRNTWVPRQPTEIIELARNQKPLILSGYKAIDEQNLEILKEIDRALRDLNPQHRNDFIEALGAVTNYMGINLQQGIYNEKLSVNEADFQEKLLYHMRTRLGEDVQEAPWQGGGETDIQYRSVTVELKVEKKIKVRRKMIEKYLAQPTQYSSAGGTQLGILCILDLTEKDNPPANPKNNITLENPSVHGFVDGNAPFPTKIAAVIIDGNLRLPSSYSG